MDEGGKEWVKEGVDEKWRIREWACVPKRDRPTEKGRKERGREMEPD